MSGMTWLLRLSWPHKDLSQNARVHWARHADVKRLARQEAWGKAMAANVGMLPSATLTFTYYPPDRRRRDAHNLPGMLKAHIDGIAHAMGCDDSGFRCLFPSKFEEPVKGGCVLVEISE